MDDDLVEVETVVLEEVPNFDALFPHYLDEWEYLESSLSFDNFKRWVTEGRTDMKNITPEFAAAWSDAEQKATDYAAEAGHNISEFENWKGTDLSIDFYRLRNADELAFRDIPAERIEQYSIIAKVIFETEDYEAEVDSEVARFDQTYKKRFRAIFEVLHLFSNGLPSDHFMLNLKNGNIDNLSEEKPEGLF